MVFFGELGLGQATKKSKITKIKECADAFWELRDFRGGCMGGVWGLEGLGLNL